ncbi:Crp/Fnr family transcriptional regulator [Spirosoma pulveris]
MTSNQHLILHQQLREFAQLSNADRDLGHEFWQVRTVSRNDFFNNPNSLCRHIGFIVKGIFRVYYVDPKTELEHNLYFASENNFITSLKSLLTRTTCPYIIEALEDAELFVMQYDHLQQLYERSHGWERFGRLLAEQYFLMNQLRSESLLTQTAEERYIDLITNQPELLKRVSLGHISSYLGIKGPSLSRIRAQIAHK